MSLKSNLYALFFLLFLVSCDSPKSVGLPLADVKKIEDALLKIQSDQSVKKVSYEYKNSAVHWRIEVLPDLKKLKNSGRDDYLEEEGFTEFLYTGEVCDILSNIDTSDEISHIVQAVNSNDRNIIRKRNCDTYERVEDDRKIELTIHALKKEPRIKDLHLEDLSNSSQWNVGVIPAKGSELGYAMYICELLNEHDLSNQVVRIVDILSVIDKGFTPKQASLKRITCDDYQVWPE